MAARDIEEKGERARLIPVAGIGTEKEAERRATSALLAVLSVARDLSIELLGPLGASKAIKASVEAFTEVPFELGGRTIRPDGLIRVTYGKSSWTALVEVKTGTASLDADQVNSYWDVARDRRNDHVITISNEIPAVPGTHPTDGLRVQSNSPVGVTHISWTSILTSAIRIRQHQGIDDPEQAWLLGELIRYLEHPKSGVLALEDMGPNWTAIRDGARASTLTKRTEGIGDIAARFDQLIQYAALQLSSQVGETVIPVLSRAHQDPKVRLDYMVDSLVNNGVLDARLRVPNTAGDIEIVADLRAQQLLAAIVVKAPEDKGPIGRVSWLVNQIPESSDPDTTLETYARNARTPEVAPLETVRSDRSQALGPEKVEPYRFRVVRRVGMSTARRPTRRQPGFVGSALNLVTSFYEGVVQEVSPWQPPTPKRKTPASDREPSEATALDADDEAFT